MYHQKGDLPNNKKWNTLKISHNIISTDVNATNIDEYSQNRADIIARVMVDIHNNISQKGT